MGAHNNSIDWVGALHIGFLPARRVAYGAVYATATWLAVARRYGVKAANLSYNFFVW